MSNDVTAALLTLTWAISEGKHFWANNNNFKIPAEGVENPDPNVPTDWQIMPKKKVVLNTFRQFHAAVGREGGAEVA